MGLPYSDRQANTGIQPDIMVVDKNYKSALNITIQTDRNVIKKECKKLEKNYELKEEPDKMLEVKAKIFHLQST